MKHYWHSLLVFNLANNRSPQHAFQQSPEADYGLKPPKPDQALPTMPTFFIIFNSSGLYSGSFNVMNIMTNLLMF